MSTIRPLATIAILAVVGVYLANKINQGPQGSHDEFAALGESAPVATGATPADVLEDPSIMTGAPPIGTQLFQPTQPAVAKTEQAAVQLPVAQPPAAPAQVAQPFAPLTQTESPAAQQLSSPVVVAPPTAPPTAPASATPVLAPAAPAFASAPSLPPLPAPVLDPAPTEAPPLPPIPALTSDTPSTPLAPLVNIAAPSVAPALPFNTTRPAPTPNSSAALASAAPPVAPPIAPPAAPPAAPLTAPPTAPSVTGQVASFTQEVATLPPVPATPVVEPALASAAPARSPVVPAYAPPVTPIAPPDYAAAKPVIDVALSRGELSRALLLLTSWQGDPSLSPAQRQEVDQLLGQLAGSVVYSNQHLLEGPYTVRPGETLETIAQHYNVPWQLLGKINGVASSTGVSPGQTLKVVRGPFHATIELATQQLVLKLDGRYAGRFPVTLTGVAASGGTWRIAKKEQAGVKQMVLAGVPGPSYGQQLVLTDGANQRPFATSGQIAVAGRDLNDLFDILSVGSEVTVRR